MVGFNGSKLINIDVLPRIQDKRNFGKINWDESIGMELPFQYNDVCGKIIIVGHYKYKLFLKRIINNSSYIKELSISKSSFLKGDLTRSVFSEIAFTRPDLLQYFVNKDDTYKFTKTSGETVLCQCQTCGNKKMYVLRQLQQDGFICNKCSDKSISYPNKFMLNFLEQIGCKYFPEASKLLNGLEWLQRYRYDFLVIINNRKYFIEMDGYFHKNDNRMSGVTAEESQEIDAKKDSMAKDHGYQVIRIDCCYKHQDRYSYIKNNIINSDIMLIFNISKEDIDWDKCDKYALSNTFYKICNCWNSGTRNTKEIAKKLNLSWSCVYSNLIKGAELGLCGYNPKHSVEVSLKEESERNGMPCAVLKDNIIVGIFASGRELSRQSLEKFGHYFNHGHISYVCAGRAKTCFGYTIQRITKEKYDEMLSTIQN